MSEPGYSSFKANDGEELVYQSHGRLGSTGNQTILVLIHGFTGSSQYFSRNFAGLAQTHMVIAPDLRGHGRSTKARHGYHVARLAADLRDLLESQLKPRFPNAHYVGVGCSLGAAVLWTYSELFDSENFSGMVFVDQAPLQDYIPGSWSISQGNFGVHDPTSLAMAQARLTYAPDEFYQGLVAGCLGYRYQPQDKDSVSVVQARDDEQFFVDISRQGDPWWFGKLLANHTSYDHRDTVKYLVKCPCLILASKRSGSFPVEGLLETARLVNDGKDLKLALGKVVTGGHCS